MTIHEHKKALIDKHPQFMRRACALLLFISLASVAFAQKEYPRGEVFGGYSYLHIDTQGVTGASLDSSIWPLVWRSYISMGGWSRLADSSKVLLLRDFPARQRNMADDKSKPGGQDRKRINVNEDYELRDWSKKFKVSPEELKKARCKGRRFSGGG